MEKSLEPLVVKISGAAAMLSCSARTVRRMVNAGTLPAIRLTDDPRSDRIAVQSLVDFLEQGGFSCQSISEAKARIGTTSSSSTASHTGAVLNAPTKRGPRSSRGSSGTH